MTRRFANSQTWFSGTCSSRGINRWCSKCLQQVPSAGGAVPLLNYQPALYQQATINIPGLAQQSVPIPTRAAGLCSQTEPFQQTLIVCPPSTIQGKRIRSQSSWEKKAQNDSRVCGSVFISILVLLINVLNCFPGLQPSSESSSFPVRMENSVPIVPQNPSAQSLQIQPSMLTQVRARKVCWVGV